MKKSFLFIMALCVAVMMVPITANAAALGEVDSYSVLEGDSVSDIKFIADVTLSIKDDSDIIHAVTTTVSTDSGTLAFAGTTTVVADIGESATVLKLIQIDGIIGSEVTFNGDVYATTLTFTGDATATIADDSDIAAAITTSSSAGALAFSGVTTVTGQIGEADNKLRMVEVNGTDGSNVNFIGDIYATTLNFSDQGTATIADDSDITAAITTDNNGQGALTFSGTTTVTGDVGAAALALAKISVNGTAGSTVSFVGDIHATTLQFSDDATVTIADDSDVWANITHSGAGGKGYLAFSGTTTVTGDIGTSTSTLRKISADGVAGSIVNLIGDVYATTLTFTGDATVNIADDSDVYAAITTSSSGALTFAGVTTVTGQVGTSSNKLRMVEVNGTDGSNVNFIGDIYATTLNFSDQGTATIADDSNVTAAITTDNNGQGALTLSGSHTVTGNVGAAALALAKVSVNGTAGSTVSFVGDIHATTLQFSDDATVTIADDSDVWANITHSGAGGKGYLAFSGTTTVTGDIGSSTSTLRKISADGAAGSIVNLIGDVYATTLEFSDDATVSIADDSDVWANITHSGAGGKGYLAFSGTTTVTGDIGSSTSTLRKISADGAAGSIVNLNGDVYATTLTFTGDATVNIADDSDVYAAITTSSSGALTFAGVTTVTGQVGTSSNKLRMVEVNGTDGSNVNFIGDIYATTLNFSDQGTATIADDSDITAAITTDNNGQGALTLSGSHTVTGNIGAAALALAKVSVNGAAGSTVSFVGDIHATTLQFSDDATVTIADDSDVWANITHSGAGGKGYLAFSGTTTVTGDIGSSTSTLRKISADGAAGSIVNLNGDVYATTLTFTSDATVNIADDSDVCAAITTSSSGALTFSGVTTVTGQVGTSDNKLRMVEVNGSIGSNVNFIGDVYATTLNFSNNGTATIADDSDVTAAITTDNNGQGALTLSGSHTVTGDVGASGALLRKVSVNGTDGSSVSFTGDIYATTLDFGSQATVNIADNKDLTAAVTTSSNGQGALTFAGTTTVTGNVGAAGAALAKVTAGVENETVTFNGDVHATTLTFSGDGAITIADDSDVYAAITNSTTSDSKGTLTFSGANTVTGNVGASGALLKLITVAGTTGSIVNLNGDVYATTLNFTSDGTVTIADDSDIWAAITNTGTTNNGNLSFAGTTTVTGNVGASGAVLKRIAIAGTDGSTVKFTGNVYATTMNFDSQGTVTMAEGKNITGAVTTTTDGQGALTFLGGATTTGGNIGTDGGAKLAAVNFEAGTVSIGHHIAATNVNVKGTTVATYSASKSVDGSLTLSGTATLDVGQYTLSNSDGVTIGDATTYKLDVASDTTYGNITSQQQFSIGQNGILDINVTGYVTSGTIFTIADASAGTAVIAPTTINCAHPLYTFTASASGAQDLTITAAKVVASSVVSGNQGTLGDFIDSLGASSGTMATLITDLNTYASNYGTDGYELALKQLSPEPVGGSVDAVLAVGGAVGNVTVGHLAEARTIAGLDYERGPVGPAGPGGEAGDQGLGAWAQTFGSFGDQNERDGKLGYEYDTYGVMIGIDGLFNEMVLGISSGYAWTDVDTDTVNAESEVGTFNLGVYGTYGVEDFYLNSDIRYARNNIDSTREIAFRSQTATGDTDAHTWSFLVGGGYYLGTGNWILTPNLSMKYTYFDMDAYTETGAPGANLWIDSYSTDSVQSNLGVRTGYQDDKYLVDLRANYIHEFEDKDRKIKAGFDADPSDSTFVVEGMDPDQDFYMLGAGIRAFLEDGISVSLNYDLELREEFAAQTITGEVRIDF